jgi:D-glycero-D-manno-heptose 1,7-bisphosphate phosphatase
MMSRRFVLLDRDGTINVEREYLARADEVELLPNALAGLSRLRRLGLGLAVVTNQSGLGRGYFDRAALDAIHQRLADLLAIGGVALDGVYVCPHVPEDGCPCRKPEPGLARRAAVELGIDLARAFVIGDKPCDIELGRRVGATTILVRTGYGARVEARGEARPDFVVADLLEAAEVIGSALQSETRTIGRGAEKAVSLVP